jgi:hypothetical protein
MHRRPACLNPLRHEHAHNWRERIRSWFNSHWAWS